MGTKLLSLGIHECEILHFTNEEFKGTDGKPNKIKKVSALIPSLSNDVETIYVTFEIKKGKAKYEVVVTGKAKNELKFKLREPQAQTPKVAA